MKKVNFIGRNFHRESGSADFFIEILSKHFYVNKIYPDAVANFIFEKDQFELDSIFFVWQSEHIAYVLSSMGYNVINISMFDGVENRKENFFIKLTNCLNINFSKTLHDKFIQLGIDSKYLKFYPEKFIHRSFKIPNSIFFWERDPLQISCEQVINKFGFDFSYNFHGIVSPRKEKIMNDYNDFNINFTSRISDKNQFLNFLSPFQFFIAPRLTEGIGMSFLDAMNVGCIPIGSMRPTFSEYVKSNINGFDLDNVGGDINRFNLDKIIYENELIFSTGRKNFIDDTEFLLKNCIVKSSNDCRMKESESDLIEYIFKNFHRPDHCMDLMDK